MVCSFFQSCYINFKALSQLAAKAFCVRINRGGNKRLRDEGGEYDVKA